MMKRARKLTADLMTALLLVVLCSVVVHSQDANGGGRARRPPTPPDSSRANATPSPGMGLEEKLVRDVYARLMRYQSAGLDESRERGGKTVGTKDYLTFELKNIQSGPISDLQSRPLSELVTARGGEVLNIRPVYLRVKDDPAFAFYEAEWATLPESKDQPAQDGTSTLDSFDRYTSYAVTARLNGKVRHYRAVALYRLNAGGAEAARPKVFRILDNVTAEMNTVYADESPRVRIPWTQYVKTGRYRAVVKKIKDLKAAGQPLLPASLPAGDMMDDPGEPPDPEPDPDPTTTCAAPQISGLRNVWWFNGQNPTGYATSITLTASPSTGSSYTWTVVAGNDKVVLSHFVNNTVRVTGTQPSTFREVGIRVNVDGVDSPVFRLTVRAPHRLVLIRDFQHSADGTWGYNTRIHYRIEDQFTDVLPASVPINEQWTTGVVADFPGMDWRRGAEGSATVGPSDWYDYIEGELAGHTPAPRSPCTPNLCNTAVYHWGGQWFVGSLTIGSGRRVQTNTWQKFTDHAEHTNRVSPAP